MTRPPTRAGALGAALAVLLAAACRESGGPDGRIRTSPLDGTYALTAVDGRALPATVQMNGNPAGDFVVQSGEAEFTTGFGIGSAAGWLALSVSGERAGSNAAEAIASTSAYSQPAADSVVTPDGAGRVRGDTLFFKTGATSPLSAHEWRYERAAAR